MRVSRESVSPGQDFQRIHSLGVLQAQHLSFKNGPAAEEWNFSRQLPEEFGRAMKSTLSKT
jgi:hypothetical protein